MIRALAALVLAVASPSATAEDFDLVYVTLVDGTGAPRPGVSVSVRAGKISAISDARRWRLRASGRST